MSDVADQPGLGRSLKAIALAVVLGVLFRSAFSEEALNEQIRKAAANVHAGMSIDFARADLSLADGPFPEFAIVVEGVKVSSDELCWLSPVAEVDELRLPLNLWRLLSGHVEITEVKLGQVNLQLRTTPEECKQVPQLSDAKPSPVNAPGAQSKSSPAETSAETAVPTESTKSKIAQSTEEAPLFQPPDSRGPVSSISVFSLQVQYLPMPFTSFEIDRLRIDRLSETPLSLKTVGELNLGGATLSGDYSSKARFEIDYSHPHVQLNLSGTWREGTYSLNVDSEIEKKEIDLNGSIDHLPLSQILPFLKKYNILKGQYDGRQVWLNLRFKSPVRSRWQDGVPIEVERLSFEGDLGNIESNGFHIRRWHPLEFSNTEIKLRGLQVEQLLKLFGQTEIPKSFGALGELNGVLKLEGAERLQLSGEYSGLELIFSNRGERRTQVISLMTGVLNFDQGRWNLTIPSIRPYEGLFIGELYLEGNNDTQNIRGRLNIDEMHLGPEVQALMSGGGSLGRWAADLETSWSRGRVQSVRGQVLAQDLNIDGVTVSRLRSSVNGGASGILNIELRTQEVLIDKNSPARRFLMPIVYPNSDTPQSLSADWKSSPLHLVIDTKNDDSLSWKLRPLAFKGFQLRSEGGWNSTGDLTGTVNVKRKDPPNDPRKEVETNWKVEGRRDAPVFTEEK